LQYSPVLGYKNLPIFFPDYSWRFQMKLYRQIDEKKSEHYFLAFEALEELAAKISSAEFAGASFGDVEAEIHKNGMEVLRKMAQGYLNQRRSEEIKMDSVIGEGSGSFE
jgi:hypothetical protein